MNKRNATLLGIVVGIVLFFGVNILASASLRSMRFDLTEEHLYTLSDGSKKIAHEMDEPIHLTYYFAEKIANAQLPPYKAYGTLVREVLDEFVSSSQGKIDLDVVDPEPYTEEEDRAKAEGIQGLPTQSGDLFYFGLVGTNSTGDRETIDYFDPQKQRFLEYDLARLIHSLAVPKKKVVGFLSGLPIEGTPASMMGQGQPGWKIVDYVGSLFETRTLDKNLDEIPKDVDVLVVIHPRDLTPGTLYAIDQYVLGGGKLVAFVDPECQADQTGRDPSNPLASMGASKASDMAPLFRAWGFELVSQKVAGDRQNGYAQQTRDGGRVEQVTNVVIPRLAAKNFDSEDAVTSFLQDMIFDMPGVLRPLPDAKTKFQPLVQTSDDSMEIDVSSVQFMPDPKRLLSQFVSENQKLTLAARVSGDVQTAFPDGKPGGDEKDDAKKDDPNAADDAKKDEAPAEQIKQGKINVIVCADADMLADPFWVQEQKLGPYSLGWQRVTDNGDFLLNSIENLAGGEDLISIRARGKFSRPFDRVEAIRRDAEQRFLAKKQSLESELRDTEDRINELQRQKSPDTALILSPEQEAELQKFRDKELETKKELRKVQHSLLEDIDSLGKKVKWANIGLLPLLVASAAVALGAYRVKHRTSN